MTGGRNLSVWRRTRYLLSALLVHLVVAIAFDDCHLAAAAGQVRDAAVGPVLRSISIQIDLTHYSDNRKAVFHRGSQFFVGDRALRNDGRSSRFDMAGWRIGREDGLVSIDGKLGRFFSKPPVRLLHGVSTKEHFPAASHLNRGRLPVVAVPEIDHKQLIRRQEPWCCSRNDVRTLVLSELDSGVVQLKVGQVSGYANYACRSRYRVSGSRTETNASYWRSASDPSLRYSMNRVAVAA